MSQAKAFRERIGDMLIVAGLVTPEQVDEALRIQRTSGMRLGRQLVALGYVSELQLAQSLSNQLSIPWVSLERIEFSRDLLARVPAELAERHALMPIYVRSVRDQGDTLYLATEDPTDEVTLSAIAQRAGLPVRAMIAAPSDIRRAIDRHYFAEPATPQASGEGLREVLQRAAESLHPPPPSIEGARARGPVPPIPAVPTVQGQLPKAPVPSRPEGAAVSTSDAADAPLGATRMGDERGGGQGVVPMEEYDTPSQPPARARRTLTLLDGTEVTLPVSRTKAFSKNITEVRQVVRAIRSASVDAGVEVPPTWHEVVDVVLQAFAAKGVKLTRKELADAYLRERDPRSAK